LKEYSSDAILKEGFIEDVLISRRRFKMLKGKRILSFVHDDFEDLELWYPVLRLREEGAEVVLAGEEKQRVYTGKYGIKAVADIGFQEAQGMDFDALLVPGGWAPDKLRRFSSVLAITKKMNDEKKPIGHICHGGWVLASADVVRGRTVTSTPGIKDDLIHAGATWVDKPSVVDQNIVSAQKPMDLPAYMKDFIAALLKNG
jgi:protease I